MTASVRCAAPFAVLQYTPGLSAVARDGDRINCAVTGNGPAAQDAVFSGQREHRFAARVHPCLPENRI